MSPANDSCTLGIVTDGLIALPPPRNGPRTMRPPPPSPATGPSLERLRRAPPLPRLHAAARRPAALLRHRRRRHAPRPVRLRHRRLEDRAPRPLRRLDPRTPPPQPAPRGQQRPLPDPALDHPHPNLASHLLAQVERRLPRRLAPPIRHPPRPARNLLRNPALRRRRLPQRQLDPPSAEPRAAASSTAATSSPAPSRTSTSSRFAPTGRSP